MKAVGIKVLKDNLSKYLKLVKEGEIIWITDRDEVIAEIHRPTRPIPSYLSPGEIFLDDEERRGRLRRAKIIPQMSFKTLLALARPENPIDLQRLLQEIKAD